jgi:transposase
METIVARTGMWKLQIVRRCDQHRFVVVPKRWIVERTSLGSAVVVGSPAIYERHAPKAAVFVLAMTRLMLRRLGPSR